MISERLLSFPETVPQVIDWVREVQQRWEATPTLEIDRQKLKHLAVICDGNRRAAKARGLQPFFGHQVGLEVVKGIAKACRRWGIQTGTVWLWSTENWEREKQQVEFIMNLARLNLQDDKFLEELCQNETRFTHLGRKDRLPEVVSEGLRQWEEKTAGFTRHRLNIGIDYGGLDETARAFVIMVKAIRGGILSPESILASPQTILGFLDTVGQPLPDLVIRTGMKEGGPLHTSGFMPLQTADSVWWFSPVLFPDLTPQDILVPIQQFLRYERRFGK